MPKTLFYAGTVVCFFLALMSAGEVVHQLRDGELSFVALPGTADAVGAILAAFGAGLAIAALFLRMASLLAARNLFAGFLAAVTVGCAMVALVAVLMVQWRLTAIGDAQLSEHLGEVHFTAVMVLGFFVALSLLSLRPYFSIQASRFLSALVCFPLPLFASMMAQEIFVTASPAPLPRASQASVFLSMLSLAFFSIAVHCIRHRHLFLEMTNLRELLDTRVDPGARHGRAIGGVAFDS
jgi:hypothetical protein